MALLPANRTTPVAAYIAVGTVGSAANSLRGSTVTDVPVNGTVRRPPGSTTTTLPPRSRMALRCRRGLGTCRKLHLETMGFAPTIRSSFVLSRSGNGWVNGKP